MKRSATRFIMWGTIALGFNYLLAASLLQSHTISPNALPYLLSTFIFTAIGILLIGLSISVYYSRHISRYRYKLEQNKTTYQHNHHLSLFLKQAFGQFKGYCAEKWPLLATSIGLLITGILLGKGVIPIIKLVPSDSVSMFLWSLIGASTIIILSSLYSLYHELKGSSARINNSRSWSLSLVTTILAIAVMPIILIDPLNNHFSNLLDHNIFLILIGTVLIIAPALLLYKHYTYPYIEARYYDGNNILRFKKEIPARELTTLNTLNTINRVSEDQEIEGCIYDITEKNSTI